MNHNHNVVSQKYEYPFSSVVAEKAHEAQKKGVESNEWHAPGKEIGTLLHEIHGPILELGGPSDLGYYFLEGQELPSRPIISNIVPNTLEGSPYSTGKQLNELTDLLIDGRTMDTIPDASLGAVLTSYLSDIDYDSPDAKTRDSTAKLNNLIEEAIVDNKLSAELLDLSLRLKIAKRVYSKLEPGGLYFTDGDRNELKLQRLLGFEPIAVYSRNSGGPDKKSDRYDVVYQKPATE